MLNRHKSKEIIVTLSRHCHVISCQLARLEVRRGAAEAGGSGGVQRVWAW